MPDPNMPADRACQRDAAVRHALDLLDTALYETDASNLGGVSDGVLNEVNGWANNVQLHIARVRRVRQGAKETPGA